jgi:hypothetical protein
MLQRVGVSRSLTYKFAKTAKSYRPPITITDWTSDHLLVALPPLFSTPRMVRIALSADIEKASEMPVFETLCTPIYLPASSPCRNPQFRLAQLASKDESSGGPKDYLILALDSFGDSSIGHIALPATTLAWSLSERGGWRSWNSELDECSEQLKNEENAYQLLRGTYVDPTQRFNVPIRSGLDWTRKAFVSCA